MSTASLQRALVELIKNPDAHRGTDVETFMKSFDLKETEKWQLRGLASNPYIAKFGRDLRDKRYGFGVLKNLRHTKKIVDQEKFKSFLYKEFEPRNAHVKEKKLFTAFVDFLEKNRDLAASYDISSFTIDIIKYEYFEFVINADDDYKKNWNVPTNSLLDGECPFIIAEFNHDVLEAIDAIDCSCGLTDASPFEKPMTLLFLKKVTNEEEEEHVTEQFEIDAALKSFLNSQLKGDAPSALPSFYGDLVEIGLCKSLN